MSGGLKSFIRLYMLGNPLARYCLLYPLFWAGYLIFRRTGKTPWASYLSYRLLYGQTRGRLNELIAKRIRRQTGELAFRPLKGVLGSGPELEREQDEALAALNQEGYHVFKARLPEASCAALRRFAETTPALLGPPQPGQPLLQVFDPQRPRAAKYDFNEATLLAQEDVQRLLCDPTLLYLAQRYIGSVPLNDSVCMWWSAPFGNAPSSEAAQLFHTDLDRIRILKFFFYLTDVRTDTGPHVLITRTHHDRPARFYEDRRFTDEEVGRDFPAHAIAEIVGPTGTIIAADTMALHKGKAPVSGHRLILQVEYASSLFGAPYNRLALPADAVPELKKGVADYPLTFSRFACQAPTGRRRGEPGR
jgi:hypothetical protein